MEFTGKLVDRISRDGRPYKAIIIELVPGYEKMVFLKNAEIVLLETLSKK